MKDNFSGHAKDYSLFRPRYPRELFDFLFSLVPQKEAAWDCATGNGQVAEVLSNVFGRVEATDISKEQLEQAPKSRNINYSIQAAEKTAFSSESFDLITVAQAVHWFDFEPFFKEVNRTLKPSGIIALIGYGLVEVEGLKELIHYFYQEVVGPYWDPERRYIEEQYQAIPFDFEEVVPPKISLKSHWSIDQLLGYLNTWSAVKHYEKAKGKNPLDLVKQEFVHGWGSEPSKAVEFPLILKVGRKKK
ncbi:class I SAM-dependent methyltransferase [Echinicola sediminis]